MERLPVLRMLQDRDDFKNVDKYQVEEKTIGTIKQALYRDCKIMYTEIMQPERPDTALPIRTLKHSTDFSATG
jgi:hypothetical protein